jgi:hypothetical protein
VKNSPSDEDQREQLAAGAPSFAHLFVADDELRRRINPKIGRDRFRAAIRVAELRGFPKFQKIWGGRYWPAVKAWLDHDNDVNRPEALEHAREDGPEDFSAAPQRRSRRRSEPE